MTQAAREEADSLVLVRGGTGCNGGKVYLRLERGTIGRSGAVGRTMRLVGRAERRGAVPCFWVIRKTCRTQKLPRTSAEGEIHRETPVECACEGRGLWLLFLVWALVAWPDGDNLPSMLLTDDPDDPCP